MILGNAGCMESADPRMRTMDIGGVRPAVPGVTMPVPRAPAESGFSVRTELPARSAVGQSQETDNSTTQSGTDAGRREALARQREAQRIKADESRQIDQEIERDAATDALVFKKIDVQSGEVVRQVPEESMLRIRALMNSMDEAEKSNSVEVLA